MTKEYYTDPQFKRREIIKIALFLPIFGLIIYLLFLNGIGDTTLNFIMVIPVGIIGIWQVIKTSKKRPSVIINDKGITIYNPLELGTITWREIKGVRLEKILNRQFVCIDLKSPLEHKKRLSILTKKQAETSEKKLKTHVVIMEKYVSNNITEINNEIQEKIS